MSVAFGDEVAVNVQARQGRKIRFLLAQEKILNVGQLSERSGITAGYVEHPVVAEPVSPAG